jgi:tetratricopeptide (TPR) repeat protein
MTVDITMNRPTLESELAHARRNNDLKKQARLLMLLGHLAQEEKEYALAQGLYAQARDASGQSQDTRGKADALKALGQSLINGDLNEQRTACNYYEEALALYEVLGDISEQARLFVDLGYGLWRLGENERRIPLYEKALPLLAQIEDSAAQSKLAIELGGSMYGHPDFAPLYEKALLMHQQAEYRLGTTPD